MTAAASLSDDRIGTGERSPLWQVGRTYACTGRSSFSCLSCGLVLVEMEHSKSSKLHREMWRCCSSRARQSEQRLLRRSPRKTAADRGQLGEEQAAQQQRRVTVTEQQSRHIPCIPKPRPRICQLVDSRSFLCAAAAARARLLAQRARAAPERHPSIPSHPIPSSILCFFPSPHNQLVLSQLLLTLNPRSHSHTPSQQW